MKLVKKEKNNFTLMVTMHELSAITNALKEVCTNTEMANFETRLGITKEEARQLLERVNLILNH